MIKIIKQHKKIFLTLAVFAVLLPGLWMYLFFGAKQTDTGREIQKGEDGTASLIVYFTRSGNILDKEAENMDAISSASLTVNGGSMEFAAYPDSIDQYDVIYVGYPIWWFNAPMAIGSFLEHYDLDS